MNIPPGFWDNSQCEALSAMKCGRKNPDFAEYQEIRADKSHQEENNNGKKPMNLRVKTAEITQELQIRTAMVMK